MPQQLPSDLFTDDKPQLPADIFAESPAQQRVPDIFQQQVLSPPEPSWWDTAASYIPQPVKSAWSAISEPLTTLPSQAGKAVSNYLDTVPIEQETGQGGFHDYLANANAKAKGFFQGASEGLGDFASNLTSPMSIGTLGLGGVEAAADKTGYGQIANLARVGSKVAGAPMVAHGAANIVNPNATLGERAQSAFEIAGGATPYAHAPAAAEPLPVKPPTTELPIAKAPRVRETIPQTIPYEPTSAKNAANVARQEAALTGLEQRGMAEPEVAPHETTPEVAPPSEKGAFNPEVLGKENRNFIDGMPDEAIQDFIRRQGANPNYTSTETGQNILKYAEYVLNERTANPAVDIAPELPKGPAATNMTPENVADVEAWYRFKKIYETGKMTPEQMMQWGEIHNRVKDLKPNGSFEIKPNRFDTVAPEEPKFTAYELPDGTRVNLDTSATKGAETTSFQLKSGEVVTAKKIPEFDPASLTELQPTPAPEMEFLNPTTHEIRPASQAEPGDIPLPAAKEPTAPPTRRAGGRMNAPNLGLSKAPEVMGQVGGEIPPTSANDATLPPVKEGAGPRQPAGRLPQYGPTREPVQGPLTPRGTMSSGMMQGQPPLVGGLNPVVKGANPRMYGPTREPRLGPRKPPGGIPPIPKPPEPPSMASQIWNAPRSLQSVDLPGITSAALRQSRPLAFTRDWFSAWGKAYKAFGSDAALQQIHEGIKANPYFNAAKEAGVKFTDSLGNREEVIASSLAEKIPGYGRYVKASNRAYTGFLNDLRMNKFADLMEGAKASGRPNDAALNAKLADFVNNATGRGSLKFVGGKLNLEPIADTLGNALYSPRALSARLAFMNPANYTIAEPLVRQEYWKSLARIGVSWGAFSGLASLIPSVKVSTDPNNADFGKIRIGNTRIDPGAGFQQLLVLSNRELPTVLGGGGTSSSTGLAGQPGKFTQFGKTPMSPTRLSLAGRYVYNQLNPSLRFITDMLSATKKEPIDLTDRSLQMALPMYATDIADAAKDDQYVAAFFAPLLSSMGTGVQTYDKGSFNKPQITPFVNQVLGTKVPTTLIGR